jgi:hypothetical protein
MELPALTFFLCGWERRHTPEAKASFCGGFERPKAEALGYLDAITETKATEAKATEIKATA